MSKFCTYCGTQLNDDDKYCPNCGAEVKNENNNSNEKINVTPEMIESIPNGYEQKSKIAAGLFGIFLGCLGVHNFYLGYTDKAIAQVLLTCIGWLLCGLGPVAASIWGLVEGIIILCDDNAKDAKGVRLKG